MNKTRNQDVMKEVLNIMKEDYKTPGKVLLWAMAIGQWIVIIFFAGIILFVVLSFVAGLMKERRTNEIKSEYAAQEKRIEERFARLDHIIKFLEVSADSINDRQTMLDNLAKLTSSSLNDKSDSATLEQRGKALSIELINCNKLKEKYEKALSKIVKYFDLPGSKEFKELIGTLAVDKTPLELHIENMSKESERWAKVCTLCQEEVKKANNKLVQGLNSHPTQPLGQIER